MDKKRIIKILALVGIFAIWRFVVSNEDGSLEMVHISGTTMGPIPYSIKYLDKEGRNFQPEIDSLLDAFNNSLSTYIPSSEISRFNNENSITFETPFFYPVLLASKEVFENTGGAFDPTIGPLVNAWGFGPNKKSRMDSTNVDSLLSIIGFDKIQFDSRKATKENGMFLDFSAIAKGNGIDVVADLLGEKGIGNYMVEIGGEVICKGDSDANKPWMIGVQKPTLEKGSVELMAKISIKDKAIATSGNYRNYYIQNGKMIAHTINPFTGYTTSHNLLSASVFAKNCTLADAYATACMVIGFEKSKELVNNTDGLEGFFIYTDEEGNYKTYASLGIESYIELIN